MKIELTCPHCESVLRVDSEHAGKQLRCPNCQNLTSIPVAAPVEPSLEPSAYSRPMDDFSQPPPHYINSAPGGSSQQDSMSLVFGIAGIIMNLGCGCFIPVFVILNCIGLFWAIQSNGPMRNACMITNGIALGIAGFRILAAVAFGAISVIG